jgi:hypothetical protein
MTGQIATQRLSRSEMRVRGAEMALALVAEDFSITPAQRIENLQGLSDKINELIDATEDRQDDLENHLLDAEESANDLRAAADDDEDDDELDEEVEEDDEDEEEEDLDEDADDDLDPDDDDLDDDDEEED